MFSKESLETSSVSSSFSSVENVIHLPNKPRLSIDATARATNTIRLSPGFIETGNPCPGQEPTVSVASSSRDDPVSRRIHEATTNYNLFGSQFFKRFRDELASSSNTYERLRANSLRRRYAQVR